MKSKKAASATSIKVNRIPFSTDERDEIAEFLASTGRVFNRYVRIAVLEKMAKDKAREARR